MRLTAPITAALAATTFAQTPRSTTNSTGTNATATAFNGTLDSTAAALLTGLGELPFPFLNRNSTSSAPRTASPLPTVSPTPLFGNSTRSATFGSPAQPTTNTRLPTTEATSSTRVTTTSSTAPTTTHSATPAPTHTPTPSCVPAPVQDPSARVGAIAGSAGLPPALSIVSGVFGYIAGGRANHGKGAVMGAAAGLAAGLPLPFPLIKKLIVEDTEWAMRVAGAVVMPFAAAASGTMAFGAGSMLWHMPVSDPASDGGLDARRAAMKSFYAWSTGGAMGSAAAGTVGSLVLVALDKLSQKPRFGGPGDCAPASSGDAVVGPRSVDVDDIAFALPEQLMA